MLQLISDKYLDSSALCDHGTTLFQIGKYNISQFSNISLSFLHQNIVPLVEKLNPVLPEDSLKELLGLQDEVSTLPYVSILSRYGTPTICRKASSSTQYPVFYIEMCRKNLEKGPSIDPNEYILRLGPMEPILTFKEISDHSHQPSHAYSVLPGYLRLSLYTFLTPLYFATSAFLSLEVYLHHLDTSMKKKILSYTVSAEEFISQARRTYIAPVSRTAELRITYCGSYSPSHISNLAKIPLVLSPHDVGQLPVLGHRGCGSNWTHSQRKVPIAENTPLSILTAQQMGYIGSELDVILTKDRIPVVNHDFEFTIIVDEQLEANLPIPFTLYEDLVAQTSARKIKIDKTSNASSVQSGLQTRSSSTSTPRHSTKMADSDCFLGTPDLNSTIKITMNETLHSLRKVKANYSIIADQKCIYTLEEMITRCPGMLLNVEIKYPSRFSPYHSNYVARIDLVQIILETLKEKNNQTSRSREFFLSSFDPLICIIARLQAPTIPVFLLFLGDNERLAPYMDVDLTSPGQFSSEDAVSIAVSVNLTGMVLWKEILDVKTGSMSLHEYAFSHNLMILTYGSRIGEELEDQRAKGVSALICDLCHHKRQTTNSEKEE